MALGKSYALLFAFLAGRCALGADDDVNGDADVKAYFDLNEYPDAHQDLRRGMDESLIPCQNDIGDDVAISTAASSTGRHIERIDHEHRAVLTGTCDDGTMRDPASRAVDHYVSGTSSWVPADVASCILDFAGQSNWVSYDHDQLTAFTFDAGATSSSTAPKVTCVHCGTEVSTRTILDRHQEHSCKGRQGRRRYYCKYCPDSESFSRQDSLLRHEKRCPYKNPK